MLTLTRLGGPQPPGPEHAGAEADQRRDPKHRRAAGLARPPEVVLQLLRARALQTRAVTAEGGPAVDDHAVGQGALEWAAHGVADSPPDGHGEAAHSLVDAAEVLAGALPLGARDADVEGVRREEALGIGRSGTPGHHGPGQDQGLQRPSVVLAAAGGVCGMSRVFPDLGGEKLSDRAGERLGPLGLPSRLLGRGPRCRGGTR